MNTKLLRIQPRELEFIVELKKQSSCTIQLANETLHHVAYKIKTTSPKKYCVRPNVGIITPASTCEFSVTMRAQQTAPLDMVCRDKFLIQSTIVPSGTTEVTPDMFSKEGGRYIEEDKLKVALISPPSSPIHSPINGALMEGIVHEDMKLKGQSGPLRDGLTTRETPEPKYLHGISKEELPSEVSVLRNQNGLLKEGVDHEASRLGDKTVTLKGGLPHDAPKLRDQNRELYEEVLLHDSIRWKDQNRTLKKELPQEAIKSRDLNGALMEEMTHKASKISDENGTREGITIQPPLFNLVKESSEEMTHKASKRSDENGTPEGLTIQPPISNLVMESGRTNELTHRASEISSGALEGLTHGTSCLNNQLLSGADIHPRQYMVSKDVNESQQLKNEVSKLKNIAEIKQAAELELMTVKESDRLKLVKGIDEIKSKLNEIELKLGEAQATISKMLEERSSSVQDIRILKDKLVELSRRERTSVQVGFPPLFICMVALICILLGHLLRH